MQMPCNENDDGPDVGESHPVSMNALLSEGDQGSRGGRPRVGNNVAWKRDEQGGRMQRWLKRLRTGGWWVVVADGHPDSATATNH
jgi:hypothetical protein